MRTPLQPPFSASAIKIRRAQTHLAELELEIAKFIDANPVTVTTQSRRSTEVTVNFVGVSEIISAIVGDIIHNLRAALDLAACDLVRIRGESDRGVYFPFCDSPEDLRDMIKRKRFNRAGRNAVALLHELRPYRNGNSALRAIHDLDIQDKHQFPDPGIRCCPTSQSRAA
jgi:hypothetical protein